MGVQNSVHMFQIGRADFACPSWFSPEAKRLLKRILDPNPLTVSSELKAFLLFHLFFLLLRPLHMYLFELTIINKQSYFFFFIFSLQE